MRTILIVIILIVACGVGLGFYRGWISLSSGNDSGQSSITLSVDEESIQADIDEVRGSRENAEDAPAPTTERDED